MSSMQGDTGSNSGSRKHTILTLILTTILLLISFIRWGKNIQSLGKLENHNLKKMWWSPAKETAKEISHEQIEDFMSCEHVDLAWVVKQESASQYVIGGVVFFLKKKHQIPAGSKSANVDLADGNEDPDEPEDVDWGQQWFWLQILDNLAAIVFALGLNERLTLRLSCGHTAGSFVPPICITICIMERNELTESSVDLVWFSQPDHGFPWRN